MLLVNSKEKLKRARKRWLEYRFSPSLQGPVFGRLSSLLAALGLRELGRSHEIVRMAALRPGTSLYNVAQDFLS